MKLVNTANPLGPIVAAPATGRLTCSLFHDSLQFMYVMAADLYWLCYNRVREEEQ